MGESDVEGSGVDEGDSGGEGESEETDSAQSDVGALRSMSLGV